MENEIAKVLNDLISWTIEQFHENITIPNNYNEIYIATYFLTQVEYAKAIASLIEKESFIAVPPTFRSLFEAHIDLVNLCKHEYYHYVLLGIFYKQEIKKFETCFKEPDNPFLPDVSNEEIDFGTEIRKMKDTLKSIKTITNKKFGKKIFQIRKRFELAEIEETYSGIYSILSSHSHNDLFEVDTRHVEINNGDITIHIEGQWELSNIESPILTLPGVLLGSLDIMFEKFSVDKEDKLHNKRKEVMSKLQPKLETYR